MQTALPTELVSGVTTAVTTVTTQLSNITGFWPVAVALAFFVIGCVVALVSKFFGKRGGKKKRR